MTGHRDIPPFVPSDTEEQPLADLLPPPKAEQGWAEVRVEERLGHPRSPWVLDGVYLGTGRGVQSAIARAAVLKEQGRDARLTFVKRVEIGFTDPAGNQADGYIPKEVVVHEDDGSRSAGEA